MEINIVVGLYGSGKSTLLSDLKESDFARISLDELDKSSRQNPLRIAIMFDLFQHVLQRSIDFQNFSEKYSEIFLKANGSLANTLFSLYELFTQTKINESIKSKLREEILIPSIIQLFIEKIKTNNIESKKLIVDSGAMHFISMNESFFTELNKYFVKIKIIYLNNQLEQILSNLFRKNDGHFAFLERGFKKDIYELVYKKFNVVFPKNLIEVTNFIEANKSIQLFIVSVIRDILIQSKERLDFFIKNLNKSIIFSTLNINFDDNLQKTLYYFKQLIGVKMETKLIPQKPKAIFFDLSSTILDSHAVDVEAIDAILVKYGMPKWADGTRNKKEKGKSMKDNFPNFFGVENAQKAYTEYLQYIIDNMERMPLINNSIEMLKYCMENGIKAIIVSNRDRLFVDVFMKKFGMESFFDGVITPNDRGFTKPDPRILTSSFERFDLDPKRDTLLFVGDAFADVRCAFKSGCIPILYTEIVRDEISPKNLERLKKVNPENPVREVKSQKEFIQLLENSKQLWQTQKPTKITYIGANGKIGKEAIPMICSQIPDDKNVEIVLVGSGSEESLTRLSGFVKDVIGSLSLQGKKVRIKFTITNDYTQAKGSDIVLCSAGRWPTESDFETYDKIDPSRRLAQSFVNAKMITEITQQLRLHCPEALFTIVTNQVDTMCYAARQVAPDMKIIGLSGGVDSSRLKQTTKEVLGLDCEGLMIGFHNVSMTPLTKSLKTTAGQTVFPLIAEEDEFSDEELQEEFLSLEQQKFDTIISTTRTLGGKISAEQRTGLTDDKDTGASILPATALVQLINGYCFNSPFVESYNTFIDNPETAHHYGIQQNTALSVPLIVTKGKIEISTQIPLLEVEKVKMREAQTSLNRDLELMGYKQSEKKK